MCRFAIADPGRGIQFFLLRKFWRSNMSNKYDLVAQIRKDVGKGASRRLRHASEVPAIVYGAGKDPVTISLPHHVILKRLEDERFSATILKLDIEGKNEDVVLKNLQRHPWRKLIMHMDFLRIKSD